MIYILWIKVYRPLKIQDKILISVNKKTIEKEFIIK
jgi:hypothetical protein